jgi:acyl-coenzyme A synthetase/AMP-(fatty) acid ligase
MPIVEEALKSCDLPDKLPVIVHQRPSFCKADISRDDNQFDLGEILASGKTHDCVDVDANDPLYIIHTSGTTGKLLKLPLSLSYIFFSSYRM